MDTLKDNIWITSKTRMISEGRYRRYDLASHLLLSYTSFLLIVSSIFTKEFSKSIAFFETYTIVLSLLVFTTSLIIYGFKFTETANSHRECYLKLQELERLFDRHTNPAEVYGEILSAYPNHAPRDYEDLVVNRTFFDARTLQVGGESIAWTRWMLVSRCIRFLRFWVLILSIPIVLTLISLLPFVPDKMVVW